MSEPTGKPKTDLDGLHKLVLKGRGGRGSGSTYAACCNLAGQMLVTLPGSTFVWFIPRYQWFEHIAPMLLRVFEEQGIEVERVERTKKRILAGGHRILFVVPDEYGIDRVRGCYLDGIVDDLGEAYEYFSSGQRSYIGEMRLRPIGSPT